MGFIIKELKIPDQSYHFESDNEREHILQNLSKINIFVGENNSGKSRFLRSIVTKEDFEFKPNSENLKTVNTLIDNLKNEMNIFLDEHNSIKRTNYRKILKQKLDEIEKIEFYKPQEDPLIPIKDFISLIISLDTKNYSESPEDQNSLSQLEESLEYFEYGPENEEIRTGGYPRDVIASSLGEELNDLLQRCLTEISRPFDDIKLNYDFEKIYIPILRGLRPLTQSNQDQYKERTFNDYFFKNFSKNSLEESSIDIFTGLNAYQTVNLYSRLNPQKRKLLEDFKEYLKNNFFDGKSVEITAALTEDGGTEYVLAVKIGDEHEKPIYDLGDGIQSIIILTLPLFLQKNKNLLVFIEEPEQLLHPGLQRKLIETFLYQEGFQNFQFFFTTHSNHFLDITLDFENISIFSLKKELEDSNGKEKVPTFSIENLSEGDTSALKLLGVRNSSVFLSNCTIWVEGITDRHYMRYYLNLYHEKHKNDPNYIEFKEDYHYSFVEYSGNNITHWSFLDKEETPINVEKLCGRLFLLADKDQGKDERHEKLKEKLGTERVHILKCREIENLVTPEILLKIVKDYQQIPDDETADYINEDISYTDYKNEPLGQFIEEKVIIDKDKMKRGGYKAKSGTIKNKERFLKKATVYIQEWNDLSPEAQEICEELYNFIKTNNS